MKTISLEKPNALYLQIAAYFEREIVSGKLLPGDKIPATTILAKQFKVNADTVQQSLKLLMSRGLIDRKPGRGTYVRHGVNTKTVGIIFGKEIYTNPDVMFFSLFLESLNRIFPANGWDCKLFSSSEFASYDKAFYELKSAIESGEVRAVIEFCSNDFIRDWLDNECPVPVCVNYLEVDFCDFTYKGLSHLYKQGCRRPLVLSHEFRGNNVDYNEGVNKFCSEYGLPRENITIAGCGSHAQTGYGRIKEFFNGNNNPDGILTANDSAFRGVLYALLEQGIKFPEEVKIITYANKGIDIFCHVPLTKLEVDPDLFGQHTYEQLMSMLNDREVCTKLVTAELVPGKSCGE